MCKTTTSTVPSRPYPDPGLVRALCFGAEAIAHRYLAGCISTPGKSVVRFAKTDVDVVSARPHAPGRLGTSQLSNPNTQWVAPSVGIA